jgi:uncharacterized protein YcaQ
VAPHSLSKRDARRIAVLAQRLDRERPGGLLGLVRHITLLQLDPTAAIAPNAHLVAWSRLGAAYDPAELGRALGARELVEYKATIRPAEDMALFRAQMDVRRTAPLRDWQKETHAWVEANDACRTDILRRLSEAGPLPSRELPDTCAVPWRSTGWTNNKNVTQLLELMVSRGEVAVAGRSGNERLWDLAERVYPDVPPVPLAEAERLRNQRRLAALGIARSRGPELAIEPVGVGDAGEEAVVEGVHGTWRVEPSLLGRPLRGRAALLSPFDRVLHDRKRTAEVFEFEYTLEMYKPAASRRWGYFALPILYGDRLVGKLDAAADRRAGVLQVNAMHWDVEPTKSMAAAVDRELADLARWLGVSHAQAA